MNRDAKSYSLLGRWYGDPLHRTEAEALLDAAQQRQAKRLRHYRSCYVCHLQRMIAHYWLGKEIDEEFRDIQLRLRNTAHGRILAELIYGQLLMSQRRNGSMAALDHAFHIARHLLTPGDYFVLVKRHWLLGRLPYCETPQPSLSLEELLTTAAVIERMTISQRIGGRRDDGSSL